MSYETRATRVHILPAGAPIFDERGFSVEIDDEAGGEFVVVNCNDESCAVGQVRVDPAEWPALRDAIDQMIGQCKEVDA